MAKASVEAATVTPGIVIGDQPTQPPNLGKGLGNLIKIPITVMRDYHLGQIGGVRIGKSKANHLVYGIQIFSSAKKVFPFERVS